MATSTDRFGRIEARVTERASGGWLAVSAPGAALSIGVVADSATEARERFDRAVRAWAALWDEQESTRDNVLRVT
jgi:hypothetical protein